MVCAQVLDVVGTGACHGIDKSYCPSQCPHQRTPVPYSDARVHEVGAVSHFLHSAVVCDRDNLLFPNCEDVGVHQVSRPDGGEHGIIWRIVL